MSAEPMPQPLQRLRRVGEHALLWSDAGGVTGIVEITGRPRYPEDPANLDRYYGARALLQLRHWSVSWTQLQSQVVLDLTAGWPAGKEFNAHHDELRAYPDEPWSNIEASDIEDTIG